MSREQYRARGKKLQKLGRDGLVEQDKATGQEERISQRAADISFGPDRSREQAAGRASSRRVPAKSRKRKQPRPSPPADPVQPANGDTLDVPYVPEPVPTAPTVRQADDMPTAAPPPRTDGAPSSKRRQQKRATRLNLDAPTRPMMEDGADGGRLHFEPGSDPPADTTHWEGVELTAPRCADDVPMRERPPGRYAPPPIQRQTQGGRRLQFEAERTSFPADPVAPNTRTRQTVEPDADTPAESPSHGEAPVAEPASEPAAGPPRRQQKLYEKAEGRLRFEAESPPSPTDPAAPAPRTRRTAEAGTPAESPPHGDAPMAEPASTPAAEIPRRQQKRYEKAERRVEQSSHRLEKAQAKLPARRRAHLEKEYDANSGKVRRRLRFETEVLPETVKPSLPAQAGRAIETAAVMKLHGKIRENERDNVALEAAHKVEFTAEQGAGRVLRWNKQRLRSKPYRAVRRAEGRLRTDQTRLAWQTALRDNPDLRRGNALAKWVQKQKIKRKYAQAAREAQKTAQHTQQAMTAAGKIIRAVQQYAAAHKSALLIVAALALVISFFSAGLASCTAMLSGVQSSFLSATYLADEQEICNSELYFTELETDLQLDIASTEANCPGYDEYRYNIGDISHNPYELMGYLSAAYGAFTFEQVRPELDRLFGAKYRLTRTTVTETRYDDDGQPYEWTVLQTTLTVGRLGGTIAASLTSGEQAERYQAYMEGCGNRQAFANPFDFPWQGYVSSGYGWRVHPITGLKNLHRGVDIAAAQDTAIKAVQNGRVVSAGDMGSYGLCVVIEDDKGYQSRYAHCSSLSVSAGQEVKRGDVIGAVGSTGSSTGPHLHLEVMLDGEYLNPYYFVDTGGSGETLGPVIPDYPGEAPTTETFAAMLAEAEKYLGYPYVWGGSSPSTSFDCSGFVSWVINHSGWSVGRRGAQRLYNICTPVSAANAQPGDLVFFWHTYDAPNPNGVTHVGIYVGNGQMIHSLHKVKTDKADSMKIASYALPFWAELRD